MRDLICMPWISSIAPVKKISTCVHPSVDAMLSFYLHLLVLSRNTGPRLTGLTKLSCTLEGGVYILCAKAALNVKNQFIVLQHHAVQLLIESLASKKVSSATY